MFAAKIKHKSLPYHFTRKLFRGVVRLFNLHCGVLLQNTYTATNILYPNFDLLEAQLSLCAFFLKQQPFKDFISLQLFHDKLL